MPPSVRMFAARTWPSPAGSSYSTTASFMLILGPSPYTNAMSPILTPDSMLPVVLWNYLNEVRYSCLQRFQKCCMKRGRRLGFLWISEFPFWLKSGSIISSCPTLMWGPGCYPSSIKEMGWSKWFFINHIG